MRTTVPLLVVLGALAAGCISQTHIPYQGDSRPHSHQPAPQARPAPAFPGIVEVKAEGDPTHDVLHLFRPRVCSEDHEAELGAIAYLSRSPGPKRWVIVLPIWGSSTYPPHRIVQGLLKGARADQTDVLWIQGPLGLIRYDVLAQAPTEAGFRAEVSRTAACIDATAEDVRVFIDWVMRRPETDPHRVGIVGFSLGGIVASLVMGRDQRLAAGVFVMVGGHLDEILAHCKWDERAVREHVASAFGWAPDELAANIRVSLSRVDPVLVAGGIDPGNVLYIDSGHDGCIPRSARDDLWRAMGQPERVTLGYDHKNSFLTMTFLGFDTTTRRILAFLDGRLAGVGTPAAPAEATAQASGRSR